MWQMGMCKCKGSKESFKINDTKLCGVVNILHLPLFSRSDIITQTYRCLRKGFSLKRLFSHVCVF